VRTLLLSNVLSQVSQVWIRSDSVEDSLVVGMDAIVEGGETESGGD